MGTGPARGPRTGSRDDFVHASQRVASGRGRARRHHHAGDRQPAGADRGQGRAAAEVRDRVRRHPARAAAVQVRRRATRRCSSRTARSSPSKTGVEVTVTSESWADLRPKTATAAAIGSGPDIVCAWSDDPHKFEAQCVDLTDLASYLGEKYGGWWPIVEKYGKSQTTGKWIAMPIGGSGNRFVYRKSWVNEAGYETDADRPRRLPRHGQEAQGQRPPDRLCARQCRGRWQLLVQLADLDPWRQARPTRTTRSSSTARRRSRR